jgi:hypothetical protein
MFGAIHTAGVFKCLWIVFFTIFLLFQRLFLEIIIIIIFFQNPVTELCCVKYYIFFFIIKSFSQKLNKPDTRKKNGINILTIFILKGTIEMNINYVFYMLLVYLVNGVNCLVISFIFTFLYFFRLTKS